MLFQMKIVKRSFMSLLPLSLVLMSSCKTLPSSKEEVKPPLAMEKNEKLAVRHGDVRIDPYFWMRDIKHPELMKHLQSENEYTEYVMQDTKKLQDKIYNEILARTKETDTEVPAKKGNYFYYSRVEKNLQYRIHCRKYGSLKAEEVITLDENELSRGHDYFSLGALEMSHDQNLLAFSFDISGKELFGIKFRDLVSGRILEDEIPETFGGLQWANDNKTIFYLTANGAHRPYRLFKHTLGTDAKDDKLVYEEKDEAFYLYLDKSLDENFLFLGLASSTSSEYLFIPADKPEAPWKVLQKRMKKVEYEVEHHAGKFIIRTNYHAKNFKIVEARVEKPGVKQWKDIVPHNKDVLINHMLVLKDYLVLSTREKSLPNLSVITWKNKKKFKVDFKENAYVVWTAGNLEFDNKILRFVYTSLTTPDEVYDFNLETQERVLLKRKEVPGGFDSKQYHTERIFVGAKIPLTLLYHKTMVRDGRNNLYLYGYGSYGAIIDPYFDKEVLSLVDRGFIYAICEPRGSEMMGRGWYEDGKMLHKKNTFTDFIDCTKYLIDHSYTSQGLIAIRGGSAGGLLMGAVLNMAPEFYQVAVANVPFVDVISSMLDPTLRFSVMEYEEWGNPNIKKQYEYMRSYSPYDNVKAGRYPNLLVTAGLNDSRVNYWEPAKWVAKLRKLKTDNNTLLFKTEMGAGHFGPSGRYEEMKEEAFTYAFILKMFGIKD